MPMPNDTYDIQNRLRNLEQRIAALEAAIGEEQTAIDDLARVDGGPTWSQAGYNTNKDAADDKVNEILDALRAFGVIAS